MPKYNERPEGLATSMAKMMVNNEEIFRKSWNEICKVIPAFNKDDFDKDLEEHKKYLDYIKQKKLKQEKK